MDETEQLRLAQNLRQLLVVIFRDHAAHHLGAANPAAKANEDDQILVAVRLHRGFHFVLRRLEFFLQRAPFIVLGELVDAVPAGENVFADAERLGHFHDVAADVFHLLGILRLDGDETVGDQSAEIERDLRAVL